MAIDIINALILSAAVLGLFFSSVLLCSKRNDVIGKYFLGGIVLLKTIEALGDYLIISGEILEYPHFSGIPDILLPLFGPLVFLYTKNFTHKKIDIRPVLILSTFSIGFNLIVTMPYFFQTAEYKRNVLNTLMHIEPSVGSYIMYYSVEGIFNIIFIAISIFMLKSFRNEAKEKFSLYQRINYDWLTGLFRIMGGIYLVQILFSILAKMDKINFSTFFSISSFASVSLLYAIFYLALKRPVLADEIVDEPHVSDEKKKGKYESSSLTSEKEKEYALKLVDLMNSEEPYLNPKLKIGDLSKMTGISVNHLSQVINEALDKSFADFVNEYRVSKAKKMLVSEKYSEYTILTLAMEVGFNSKSSFNSAFKSIPE